ncbi:hypothetical protein [Lactobacillus amylovorus]|uniref:hypothetical protein n=1 Tax=Lactobacillus amylovorus TaxID=1604 RepID=UPI001F0E8F19|nr:hypothetical protein [Lactobacillus amylovorus]
MGKDRFTPAFKFVVSKGAKEVVPISMIQGRKRNSINGELVIDPTDPSYREEVSPTTPADIYNHHNTVTVDPNQKQKDTINITDDPAATDIHQLGRSLLVQMMVLALILLQLELLALKLLMFQTQLTILYLFLMTQRSM